MDEIIDSYQTVSKDSEGIYRDRGSKFLAYVHSVPNLEVVDDYLNFYRSENPKANHVCFAYRIDPLGSLYRASDDGEPSGSAGKPIYNELLSKNLTNVLVAVVRFFGGTKLGVSGLINAYKSATQIALSQNQIVTKYIYQEAKVQFDHSQTGQVYHSLKHLNIDILDQELGLENWIKIGVRKSKYAEVETNFLAHFHGTSIEHVLHDNFQSNIKLIKHES